MATYETKLKLGRKLKNVDTAKASDNQVSVLFRYDESGQDRHISLSVESDDMRPEDVTAILELLDQRGVLTRSNSKTWVSQPKSSEEKFGPTTSWQTTDIESLGKRSSSNPM